MIELVISTVVLAIIVLVVGSAMTVALRSAENQKSPASGNVRTAAARSAADIVTSDLAVATIIGGSSSTGITLTVPDRTGDGQAETIVYSWAGAGQPLMRKVNGNAAVPIADNVASFSLSPVTKTVGPATAVEQGESALVTQSSGAYTAQALTTSTWASQYVNPTLPSNAASWKITRVKIMLRNPSAGTITVRVQGADAANVPLPNILASLSQSGASLSNADSWVEFDFSPAASGLTPGQGYCIVVLASAGGTGLDYATVAASSAMTWTTSTDSGSTWAAASSTSAMQIVMYGTITVSP